MFQLRTRAAGALVLATFGLLAAAPAQAASLQQVNDWGASGVPATASMYVYVPDQVADNPPILVVAHYCSGTAPAVFGQAQSGGLVSAADQYGFIIVVPQTSNNCWDVGTTAALTHDGGGDTHAIAQMVSFAIDEYQANADRVYVTGDSGGGMMTQALLAVYPDVFKGGSAFAGVPAGCWAAGNMVDGQWSSQCAGGQVTHTPEEWGDMVRAMHPGYTGHRPRVQLFHGDNDSIINYQNQTEAIKEWINVLGLDTEPTSTEMVTLGSHEARREQWTNECGYVVLDALTSLGGDHGPSDALFPASFVIPFLALDNTDPVDPEVAECGETTETEGAGGAMNADGAGGAMNAEGAGGAMNAEGAGGSDGAEEDGMSAGGAPNGGADPIDPGGATTGNAGGSGGQLGAGGGAAVGDMPDQGGQATDMGENASSGGATNTGGVGAGGTAVAPSANTTQGTPSATPGSDTTSASGSSSAAGDPSVDGVNGATAKSDDGGCAFSVVDNQRSSTQALFLGLLAALVVGGRRVRIRRQS